MLRRQEKDQNLKYEVFWERTAKENLKEIGDREIAETIESQTEKALSSNPFSNGKPITGGWEGRWSYRIDFRDKDKSYRSIYEIIEVVYRIKEKKVIIAVVKVGERTETGDPNDVYMGEHPTSTLKGRRITERPKAQDHSRKVARDNGKRKIGGG